MPIVFIPSFLFVRILLAKNGSSLCAMLSFFFFFLFFRLQPPTKRYRNAVLTQDEVSLRENWRTAHCFCNQRFEYKFRIEERDSTLQILGIWIVSVSTYYHSSQKYFHIFNLLIFTILRHFGIFEFTILRHRLPSIRTIYAPPSRSINQPNQFIHEHQKPFEFKELPCHPVQIYHFASSSPIYSLIHMTRLPRFSANR